MPPNKNNTLTYRVEQLEKIVYQLDERVDKLIVNEVPHLMKELNLMRGDIQKLKTLVTLNIGAIIAGILIAKYL